MIARPVGSIVQAVALREATGGTSSSTLISRMAEQRSAEECDAVAPLARESLLRAGCAVTMGESCGIGLLNVTLASCVALTAFGGSIRHLASERKFGRMLISPSGSPSW